MEGRPDRDRAEKIARLNGDEQGLKINEAARVERETERSGGRRRGVVDERTETEHVCVWSVINRETA